MVVAEEPVFELAPLPKFVEESGEGVPLVEAAAEFVLDAGGAAVGDDVVHGPACLVQGVPRRGVLGLAGQFLPPPGAAVHPEESTLLAQVSELLLELRAVRAQDAVGDVVAAGAAHGEKSHAADVVELPPHQMANGGADVLDEPSVLFRHGVAGQQVVVFM